MTENTVKDVIYFKYKFKFKDNFEKEFIIHLNNVTLNIINETKNEYPVWTSLTKDLKCPNCPLDQEKIKYCPIAINLIELIDFFKNSISYEEVDVTIETEARTYLKHTDLQKGVSSLIGIYMVTSGCPIMGKLKPMVRHHLPFASVEETVYRVLSMYLLAQFFLQKKGKTPDWGFKDLVKMYDEIQILNQSFAKRLSTMNIQDASKNAVVILSTFASYIPFSISENLLEEVEILFKDYF
jgi:hypothetical protein